MNDATESAAVSAVRRSSGAPKRAARYLRQSKDSTEGIERQDARTAALVEARGWRDAGTYIDNDVSASKSRAKGTAWARLLADRDAGLIDVVVAVDLDRLARSTRDLNTLIDHGLMAVTIDGEIDLTTADGEFRASMLAAIARFEVRRKGERQTRANGQRAAKGGVPKGTRALGYATDGEVLPDEADTVRALFDAFDKGETLRGLSREHGMPPSTIRGILTNGRYAGQRVYMRPVEPGSRQFVREVVGLGNWTPIVDPEQFDRVNSRLSDPRRKTNATGSTARKHLGSGLYVCECQTEPVEGVPGALKAKPGAVPVVAGGDGLRYRCRVCGLVRSREHIDALVGEAMIYRLAMTDALDAMSAPSEASQELRAELDSLRATRRKVLDRLTRGLIDDDEADEALASTKAREAEVHEALGRVSSPALLDGMTGTETEVRAAWEAASNDRKRALIDVFATVALHRARRGARAFDPASVTITPR
jgi:DNA invertase Pin-like site-specific DNA recombinase